MLTTHNLIKSLLSNTKNGYDLGRLSHIVTESQSKVTSLCTIALIYENSNNINSFEARIDHVIDMYNNIYSIIVEHNIRMPEEETLIQSVIDEESAGGEGGDSMNTTDAIEPTVPRIYTKKKKEEGIQ